MPALLEILIELVAGGLPRSDNDHSILGTSRMEEHDRRLWIGVVALIVLTFLAYKMARAKGWL